MTSMNTGGRALHPSVEEVLLSGDEIRVKVEALGRQIADDYADKRPIIVTTLKGAIIFASDLVRAIHPVPDGLEMGFVRASSYGAGTKTSGKVVLGISTLKDEDIQGRHVLLVEDIVDSGNTAQALISHYQSCGAASVAMASLLSKPARREVDFDPQYLCFTIPDKFVVGYGLDFAEHLRSLPYVGVLKPEAYSSPSEPE
ncbi:hypothetical protein Ndes2437A_g04612 [Nannochloris sp. 'desiccata']|nr:hypothetical protein KSW81_004401 [Chlorella desiccata (nom. nud.)]